MPDIATINTALLASGEPALSKREEIVIRALLGAGEREKGKPVAGEWAISEHGNMVRRAGFADVALISELHSGGWRVSIWRRDKALLRGDRGAYDTPASAMLAADAWAREHAAELDWRLPEPVAQRELTDAEVEECARAGNAAIVRALLRGETSMRGLVDAAVLSKAAEIRARGSEQPAPRPCLNCNSKLGDCSPDFGGCCPHPLGVSEQAGCPPCGAKEYGPQKGAALADMEPDAAPPTKPGAWFRAKMWILAAGEETHDIAGAHRHAATVEALAKAAVPASPQPAPRSAAPDLTARMAEALRDMASRVAMGHPVYREEGRKALALLAEYDAPPVQVVTVEEAIDALRIDLTDTSGTRRMVECDEERLRAALTAIDTSRRAFVAAAKNERK